MIIKSAARYLSIFGFFLFGGVSFAQTGDVGTFINCEAWKKGAEPDLAKSKIRIFAQDFDGQVSTIILDPDSIFGSNIPSKFSGNLHAVPGMRDFTLVNEGASENGWELRIFSADGVKLKSEGREVLIGYIGEVQSSESSQTHYVMCKMAHGVSREIFEIPGESKSQ